MNTWLNESGTDCSLMDWECIRASHYIYTSSSLTNARALQFHERGFEIGDHVGTACANYASYASLGAEYTSDLATWRAKYTSIPDQVSHRYHCYVWSDWDSQPRVGLDNDIRFDLNYVAYPGSWIGTRAPLITGSGMNMRFTDADGDMLDVRQGVTNLDNTTASSTSINSLLDNATGSLGYYGMFGTHYDMSDSYDATLYASAKARNIPVITSKQALTWTDGRDSSTFSNFGGSNGRFTFDVTAAGGAYNLKSMLPIQDAGGTLSTLTLGASGVSYQTQTVKGVQYAVFDAVPGSYTATYSDYDPNAGSGGGSSGGSGGTEDSGDSTGTSKKSSKKVTTTTEATEEPAAGQTPGTDEEDPEATPTTLEQTPDATNDDKKATGSSAWKWILGGIFLLGLAVGFYIFLLRRRNHEVTF
jgi:hypothetical protein